MGRLFRADLMKQRKSTTLWVCTILAFLFGIVMAVLYYMVWLNIGTTVQNTQQMLAQAGFSPDAFDSVMSKFPKPSMTEYANALLRDTNVLYVCAVVVGVFVGSEYSMGTIKNTIARGFTRTKVFISKFLVSLLSMMIVVASYVLGGSITSICIFGFTSSAGKRRVLMVLISYFCLFVAVAAMYMMIAIITRKTGHAIAVSIVFPILVESVITAVEVANKEFSGISKYWLFRTFLEAEDLCLAYKAYIPILIASVYTAVCFIISYLVFKRQELK